MTPRELSNKLAADMEGVCRVLLPAGRRIGRDWCCGSVAGNEGDSLKVCLAGAKAGLWSDFAEGGRQAGDAIDLVRAVKDLSVREACEWARQYLGVRDDYAAMQPAKRSVLKPIAQLGEKDISAEVQAWFKARGIEKDTLQRYKVVSRGSVVAFPCYADGGKLYHTKYRNIGKPKHEAFFTSKDSTPILFGWQAIDPNAREVVITEGECDALAYAQHGIQALSVPMGAGTGAKHAWLEHDWERLQVFDWIALSMDMDAAGQETLAYLAERLGHERVKVITLPTKDANDALLAGHDLMDFVRDAKHMDPPELRNAGTYVDDVTADFYPADTQLTGSELPWNKTAENFRLRPAEVTIWHGYNGAGKSMVLSHVCVGIMAQGQRVCIASMEMTPAKLLRRMYQQAGGLDLPTLEYISVINTWMAENCWLVAIHGNAKAERLIELFRYAYKRYGIAHIVIDSLAKCGIAEDDYNGQKAFADKLCDLAHLTRAHIHLVCHDRKGEDEFSPTGKMDTKGTGALTDMVDNVVGVWRNKRKEIDAQKAQNAGKEITEEIAGKPDCILDVQKQRHHDWEKKIALWFDRYSHQYVQEYGHRPHEYVKYDARRSDAVAVPAEREMDDESY